MHYKNGRECKVGDTVIGTTHNSEQKLRLGVVVRLMPEQGPCNVRLLLLNSHEPRGNGIPFAETTTHYDGKPIRIATGFDYADVAQLAHVEDCFRLYDAIMKFGVWDSHFINAGGKLDVPLSEPED